MKLHQITFATRFVSLLAVGIAFIGCDGGSFWPGQNCTLIGCTSGLHIALPDFEGEGFEAAVETDVGAGSFLCERVDAADGGGLPPEPSFLTGDFAGSDPPLFVNCTPEGFLLVQKGGTPPTPRIIVDAEGLSSGLIVSRGFEGIEYEVSQPNGPFCEPTCHNALLTAVVH